MRAAREDHRTRSTTLKRKDWIIGYAFGALQKKALRYHKKLQEEGKLGSAWSIMPGSMGRVAILLIVLASMQLMFPVFFEGSTIPWLVSAGVVIGYGAELLAQLRRRTTLGS